MEALAAVGLASNVIQLVQFGCQLVTLSSDIWKKKSGRSAEYIDIETIAAEIQMQNDTITDAKKRYQTSMNAQEQDTVNQRLIAITTSANVIAKELLSNIEKIKVKNSSHTRWNSFRQALDSILKKEHLEDLLSRLESLRDQLQYHLIEEIRQSQYGIHALLKKVQSTMDEQDAVRCSNSIANVTRTLHHVQQRLEDFEEQSLTPFKEIVKQFHDRFESSTKPYIILRSLYFHSMPVRHSAIAQAHKRTFEWALTPNTRSIDDSNTSIDFATWLQSGTGTYWITGKPGSGKSTMMKYLDGHTKVAALLQEWAGSSSLVCASFYFWNAGTEMQKSIAGLLRSLLFNILASCPNLEKYVCSERWQSMNTASNIQPEWSLTELKATFKNIQLQQDLPAKFYFHIDGLDEYDGNTYEVIDVIRELSQIQAVKMCVSSRPWNQFQRTLGTYSSGTMELHTLTRGDIEMFVREQLLENISSPMGIISTKKEYYKELVEEIVTRSKGVFLWVRLVVQSLRHGLDNEDQIWLLRKRLEELPEELESLFEHMIQSVDKVYREPMVRTFLAALATNEPLDLLHYSFLDKEDPYFGWTIDQTDINEDGISLPEILEQTRWRLNGRYKGLLEPASNSKSGRATVDFLHRTLKDFLVEDEMRGLKGRCAQDFSPERAVAGALFAEVKFMYHIPLEHHFVRVSEYASYAAKILRDPSFEYLAIDQIHQILKETAPEKFPGSTGNLKKPIIKAAIHIGQIGYVVHKIDQGQEGIDKDWILAHMISYQGSPRSFSDRFARVNTIQETEMSKIYVGGKASIETCTCGMVPDFDKSRSVISAQTELVEKLLDSKINKGMPISKDVSWLQSPHAFKTAVMDADNLVHWNLIKLLIRQGVKVDTSLKLWIGVAQESPRLEDNVLEQVLDGFLFFLTSQLFLDATVWVVLLFSLHDRLSTPRLRSLFKSLLEEFFRRGTNRSVLSAPLHSFHNENISWLNFALRELSKGVTNFCGQEIHELFQLFLDFNLDPNRAYEGSTIWKRFLEALIESPAYHVSHGKAVKSFLSSKADASVEQLSEFMRRRKDCIGEPEATEIKNSMDWKRGQVKNGGILGKQSNSDRLVLKKSFSFRRLMKMPRDQ